jgi:hypothetical protein
MAKVKVGTTAKGVFAIISGLLVVGGTLIGVRSASTQEASTLGQALCEQQARDHIRRFLTTTISWEGVTAVPGDPGPLNNTLYVFRDLPGFWRKVEGLGTRMTAFLRLERQELAAHTACERHLVRDINRTDTSYTESQYKLLQNKVFFAQAYVKKLLDTASTDMLGKPAINVPLTTLAQFSNIAQIDSGALDAAANLTARRPIDGLCTAGGEQLVDWMNERRNILGGLNWPELTSSKIGNALKGRYGKEVGAMTPSAFETHYKTQLKLFEDRLGTISASKPIRVAEWLPELNIRFVSDWFPFCVVGGYVLMIYLVHRLRRSASQTDAEVDLEDPGFPSNLLLPHGGFLSAALSIFLLFLPAVVAIVLTVWHGEIISIAIKATEDFACPDLGVTISRPSVAARLLSQSISTDLAWAGVLLCVGMAIATSIFGAQLYQRLTVPKHESTTTS